jgi:Type IV secretion system pilin
MKRFIVSLFLLVGLLSPVVVPQASIYAQSAPGSNGRDEACKAIGGGGCDNGGQKVSEVIRTAINVLSAIGAVIAIITVIIGGMRYITSGGDSNNVSSAKNTIIYALIGLLIIAFAQIIVQFVLERTPS